MKLLSFYFSGTRPYHSRMLPFFSVLFMGLVLGSAPGQAVSVNNVIANMENSVLDLPGLLAAVSYVVGLLLGVLGVLKLRDHVENPAQTPLRIAVVRLIAGGAMLALPIIFEAARNTIGNGALSFNLGATGFSLSGFLGLGATFLPTVDINNLLANFITSSEEVPGLVALVAYLLGLVIVVIGVLKLKDHVENPDQVHLKEGVIRLLVGGALLAIPTIYNTMFDFAGGNNLGVLGSISSFFGSVGFLYSGYGQTVCNPVASSIGSIVSAFGFGSGPTMGQSLCGIILHAGAIPAFLSALGYVLGLIFGIWGVLKIRDHVLNPQQTGLWEGVSRLVAGGAFFALPVVVEVVRNTVLSNGPILQGLALQPISLKGYNTGSSGGILGTILGAIGLGSPGSAACAAGGAGGVLGAIGITPTGANIGLSCMLTMFMTDIMGPLHVVLNFFAFVAGVILLMIGVSRLIKSAQDGVRGPGGIGTIMTFVVGGALISYNEIVRVFSTTIFGSPLTATYAQLQYAQGLSGPEVDAAHAVISAILKFVIVVGLISFVRGLFIIRSVSEGNQQASIMAGVTHIIAGAVAVNLGPLLNAVQTTLNITGFGISFT